MEERKSDPSFDNQVDKKLIQIIKNGNSVITRLYLALVNEGGWYH